MNAGAGVGAGAPVVCTVPAWQTQGSELDPQHYTNQAGGTYL